MGSLRKRWNGGRDRDIDQSCSSFLLVPAALTAAAPLSPPSGRAASAVSGSAPPQPRQIQRLPLPQEANVSEAFRDSGIFSLKPLCLIFTQQLRPNNPLEKRKIKLALGGNSQQMMAPRLQELWLKKEKHRNGGRTNYYIFSSPVILL